MPLLLSKSHNKTSSMDPTSRPHNENREASAAHPSAPRLASLPASEYMRDLANQLVVQSRRDELLKEIQANPSADEPRLTYAAYLESHPFNLRDKARAELIRLQVARGDGEATPREREILIKHERDWMRELGQVRSIVWDRGFVDSVTMSPRSFAQAHETLSREPGDDVAFLEIVRPLLRLAEEGLQSVDRPVRFTVQGDGGRLPSTVATPLSVVLTELLQNAVDHGFPEGSGGGDVVVVLANDGEHLHIRVINDGRPLDPGFQLNQATGLGLSIVRTLVTTELDGTIAMRPGEPDDFAAVGLGEQPRGAGTVVDLSVPV